MARKKTLKEKRYLLSTDFGGEKQKLNPVAEALKIRKMKSEKFAVSNSQIANRLGISRVRITQMLNLFKLAPDIQEAILSNGKAYTERQLRVLTKIRNHSEQREIFQKMS